jgi:hypothetical protein
MTKLVLITLTNAQFANYATKAWLDLVGERQLIVLWL